MGRSTVLTRARELTARLPASVIRGQLVPRPRRSTEVGGQAAVPAAKAAVPAAKAAVPAQQGVSTKPVTAAPRRRSAGDGRHGRVGLAGALRSVPELRRLAKLGSPRTKLQPPRWRRSPEPEESSGRWRSRPVLAAGLKLLVVLIPAAAAIACTALLNWGVPTPDSWAVRIGWWALLLAVSTVVAVAVEKQSRRLLPLAVLFKLTLLFPDEAPSRYRMARAAGNPQKLKELAHGTSPRSRAATHVLAWVAQLSRHDRHTRGHSERVRVFADLIAGQMNISGVDRDKLRWAALLHDVGKLRVPATVLNKPGKPNESEWDVLRRHPAAGMVLIGPLAEWLGEWAGGVADHHERYDGTGYPNGLAGENISRSGRIVAVADAYETMTAARSYKRAMAAAAGRAELARCAGSHFDPVIVRAFLAVGLPRLLYGIGPISFLVHLPFLSRLPEAGFGLVAVAGQAAAPVAAGLTAASVATATMVGPMSGPALPSTPSAKITASSSAGSSSTVSRSIDRATVSATRSTAARGNSANAPGATKKSTDGPGASQGKSPDKSPGPASTSKAPKGPSTKAPATSNGNSASKTPKAPTTSNGNPATKAPKAPTSGNPKKQPTSGTGGSTGSGSTGSGSTGSGKTKGPKTTTSTAAGATSTAKGSSKVTGSGKSK